MRRCAFHYLGIIAWKEAKHFWRLADALRSKRVKLLDAIEYAGILGVSLINISKQI